MTVLFIATPILPGEVEAWRRFCQEIEGRRQQEYEESRRRLSISSEVVWLLNTYQDNIAVIRLNAEEPEHLFARLAASQHPFDCWLKEQLHQICGLKLTQDSLGPAMELVFNWQKSN